MSAIAIIKLLKAAKVIRDYVVKENNLDQQMESVRARLDKLEEKCLNK
jgi:succinate dehydrogenase/fumarate reductase-like Fe-S protein